MDHPLIGNERHGSARQSFAAARRTAYVPPLNLESSQGSRERLERHLAAVAPSATAVATRPAPTRDEVTQAAALLREITPRGDALSSVSSSRRGLSLFAPLRKVRRWFGF
ncbi:hypothetical protein KDK95_27240 [Actinospica sp. MGRD01-02]|jgi:hypothetical protein|uniref:Uncharacterized protein n=1 Tax=Actinospica acidithermotolerans TaxID=2828514 RepID=A0A941EGL4_9ACTN|nr:hypothetical protein [Actinospica acidithermotolerans]MBR7830028.1 hypothetical protein [Actinospica acidithermotolerans]